MSCGAVDVMNFEELLKKYLALVAENRFLKEENEILKAKLRIPVNRHAIMTHLQAKSASNVDPCL